MASTVDYYRVLGVRPDSDFAEIRSRYHTLVRQHHPDLSADKATAGVTFAQINEAYRVLQNPALRARHDVDLAAAARTAAAVPQSPPPSVAQEVSPSGNGTPTKRLTPKPPPADLIEERKNQAGWNWKATAVAAETATNSYYAAKLEVEESSVSAKVDFLENGGKPRPGHADGSGFVDTMLLDQAHKAIARRHWDEAEDFCTRFVAANRTSSIGLELLGDIVSRDGRLRQALGCYRAAHRLDPENEMLLAKIDCLKIANLNYAAGDEAARDDQPSKVQSQQQGVQSRTPPPAARPTFQWLRDVLQMTIS